MLPPGLVAYPLDCVVCVYRDLNAVGCGPTPGPGRRHLRGRRTDGDDAVACIFAERRQVPFAETIICEGVSASRRAFRKYLAFAVWVELPRVERLRRGLARDGEDAREQWLTWMAGEDEYVARESPDQFADLIVDGLTGATQPAQTQDT